jgi:exosortase
LARFLDRLRIGLADPRTQVWGRPLLALALLGSAVLWAYWPSFVAMEQRWSNDPQYSHGFLVPVFALAVLWMRQDQGKQVTFAPSVWGLPWLAAGFLLRLLGAAVYIDWFDAISLLPTLLGVCVLLGGWPALRWAAPAVGFLIFMLPVPFTLEVALAHPLQRFATVSSTYLLQMLGIPALAEGNIIVIEDVKLGVVEACSGLGMLVTFFALSTAVALIVQRPWPEKLVIFLSAVPIAVAANVIRITLTGVLYRTAGSAVARVVWHDLAGWLMMPLALGMLWMELQYLSSLFVEPEPERPLALDLSTAEAGPDSERPREVCMQTPASPTLTD